MTLIALASLLIAGFTAYGIWHALARLERMDREARHG